MLLYPSMPDLLKKIHNRYMLVNVVASRARQISDRNEANETPSDEKPVSEAVREIADGSLQVTVIQPDD